MITRHADGAPPARWSPGETVSFEARGGVHAGVVVRCNRRTVLVETPEGRWRVPPARLVAGGGEATGSVTAGRAAPIIGKGDVVKLKDLDGLWLVASARGSSLHAVGGVPPLVRLRAPARSATLAPARDPAAIELRIAVDTERSGWRIGDRARPREATADFTGGVFVGFGTERAQVRDPRGQRWSIPYGLLEPGRRRRADAERVRRVHRFANRLLGELAECLGDWRFALDDGQRRAGACFPVRRLVTVSRQFALEAPWDEVRDTVIHEVAHALTPGHDHGPVWRQAALDLGGSGRRTHSVAFGIHRRAT